MGKRTRLFEIRALRRVLSECSRLVDMGYLDEIIIVDGSRDKQGAADYTILQEVVKLAFDSLSLFRIQVDLINEYPAERVKARRGFFDFIVKAVHQFDKNILDVLTKYGIHRISGFPQVPPGKEILRKLISLSPRMRGISSFPQMPPGKGTALWLSIPIAQGDILCFIDSDIRNFTRKYVAALCDPMIQSWAADSPIKLVKAYYRRLTYSFEPGLPQGRHRLGGRVSRLFMRPLLKILSEEYPEVFGGLNTLRFPLSGEQAIRKDLVESMRFPTNYAIEISLLAQLKKWAELSSMRQVDFELLYHIGQSSRELVNMVSQITYCVMDILEENKIHLSEEDVHDLISQYKEEAMAMMPYYQKMFQKTKDRVARLFKGDLFHSEDSDKRTIDLFFEAFEKALRGRKRGKTDFRLPPWSEIREKTDYHAVSQLLRIRSNQSTQSRLREVGLTT